MTDGPTNTAAPFPSRRRSLAVIVPTLDEESSLGATLESIDQEADEIVVSDGGSRDATLEIARARGCRVVTGPPGRGGQLNRGAAAAESEILVFLHADTRLPAAGLEAVREAIENGAEGGAFLVGFDEDRPILRLGARIMNLRSRLTRLPLGDQAQFVTREAFARLGRYPEWPILEDLDFIRRMKRGARMVLLEPPVTTAARRFLGGGIARTIATNWLIWALYLVGVSPHRLARLYRKIR